MKANKYKAFPGINLPDRQWPSRVTTQAPIWCSVDLRDGNQALASPMTVEKKLEMFQTLVHCGFKQIEVGFPASSEIEFSFVRRLIDENLIPDDVTIQVLVQAREQQIKRTVESLVAAKRVIIHLYNSTSPAQRRLVFRLEKPAVVEIAVQGTKWIKEYAKELLETEVILQYSPESFSATEIEFSVEICEAVMKEWQPTPDHKMIFNLPETVEVATPNVYADQIEWFCTHISKRDSIIVSVHTHNDRGTGIAATELGLLAGADRVEGTLFGNGERTGNLDIVVVALNLLTQGVDPMLDFSRLDEVLAVYENCTGMTVPVRQPYSGALVLTAFSGSHQDAVKKGLEARPARSSEGSDSVPWEVPYLIIDPADVGRSSDGLIRITSQSGKGGIAYILEKSYGIHMPKDMQREFGLIAGGKIDHLKREVTADDLFEMLKEEYFDRASPYSLQDFSSTTNVGNCRCQSIMHITGEMCGMTGSGNGPIDAFVDSLRSSLDIEVCVLDQSEHTLGLGSDASAIAYIQLRFANGEVRWGAGIDESTELASIKAVTCALNRGYA